MAPKKPEKKPAPQKETTQAPAQPAQPAATGGAPPITQAEEKRLVQGVDAAERDVKAAQDLVTAAERKLSDAIKAISDKLGSGPFIIKGRRVTISSRNDTFFFKGDRQDARTLG